MDVPEGWNKAELGTVADVAYGLTVNKQRREAKERAPYLRVANVKAGQLDLSEVKDIGVIGDDTERYRVLRNDILLVEGNGNPDLIGAACIWRDELPGVLHQNHLIRVRVSTTLADPHWLLCSLNSASGHQQILGHAKTSSGLYTINSNIVRQLQLQIPPLGEQRKIAAIMSSVDEAIEKTQAVIDQVQVVKKGLMQELLTRGLPGLHKKFKQTELGEIPDEWEVVQLESVARRGSGHTPDKKHPEYWNGNIKWVSLRDSHRLDQVYINESEHHITPLGIKNSSAVEHPAGTVILSRDAGVGKSAIMTDAMAVSQHFMAWQCGPRLHNLFLYYTLQSMKPEFERIAIGNTIKTIGLPYFKQVKISLPRRAEQDDIAHGLLACDERNFAEARKAIGLQILKQSLLSVLLTGEIRVAP